MSGYLPLFPLYVTNIAGMQLAQVPRHDIS
jgi:hypothetical protein